MHGETEEEGTPEKKNKRYKNNFRFVLTGDTLKTLKIIFNLLKMSCDMILYVCVLSEATQL